MRRGCLGFPVRRENQGRRTSLHRCGRVVRGSIVRWNARDVNDRCARGRSLVESHYASSITPIVLAENGAGLHHGGQKSYGPYFGHGTRLG